MGNPGARYRDTRHNVGFRFLDLLAREQDLYFVTEKAFKAEIADWRPTPDLDVMLVKPLNFMNNSGETVGKLARYYRIATEAITVVYDDLDMDAGKLRIKKGGGHGGHNGLRSLNLHVGNAYTRVKIGIGRPPDGDVTRWVLSPMTPMEEKDEALIFSCLLPEMVSILEGRLAQASNRIHLNLRERIVGEGG
ncbi:MAG: aminoacyl-tRNA hydrolase [Zetaproteobacteria bacterium]|nr:MAG: aminoacyl-tRNA hydrolase [Zetaproteobacteria bacterium]